MPSAQKPAGAEDAERALSREQPVAADAAAPTPANQGSASAEGVEFIEEDLQQDPPGNGDLLPPTHNSHHRPLWWRNSRRAPSPKKEYHPTHPTKERKSQPHFKSTWLPLENQWQGTNALNKGRQEGPRLQNPH